MRTSHYLILLLFLLISNVYASENSCIQTMDKRIGILYLCGIGGQFKVLSLERCNVEDSDIPEVVAFLKKHPRINALDLGQDNITDKALVTLAASIKNLTWINVSYNNIGNEGAKALASISTLTHVDMIDNHVSDDGALALAKMPNLIALDLGRNNINPTGALALAKLPKLEILYLDANNLDDASAIALAANEHIVRLYISGNHISNDGAIAIAANNHLGHVGLMYNRIGDPGAFALAKNTSIQWLYIDKNQISETGVKALNANTNFIEVSTSGNGGSDLKESTSNKFLKPNLPDVREKLQSYCK